MTRLEETVNSVRTVADVLKLIELGAPDEEAFVSAITYRGGVPFPPAEYEEAGAALCIEWFDVDPECGAYLTGCVNVVNPLRDQGVDDRTAAAMIMTAYELTHPKKAEAPEAPEAPEEEDMPF